MTRDPVVQVPADVDVEDRLVGPLTFRAAAWLAVAAAGAGLVALTPRQPLALVPGVLLAITGVTCALWRPGGRPVTAWVLPLVAYLRRRRATEETDGGVEPASSGKSKDEVAANPDDRSDKPPTGARRRHPIRTKLAFVLALIAAAAALVWQAPWTQLHRSPDKPSGPGTPINQQVPPPVRPEAPPPVVVPVEPWWIEEAPDDGFVICPCFL